MDFKSLQRKARQLIDRRGGSDRLKADAEEKDPGAKGPDTPATDNARPPVPTAEPPGPPPPAADAPGAPKPGHPPGA
jgi:hypothetical protein